MFRTFNLTRQSLVYRKTSRPLFFSQLLAASNPALLLAKEKRLFSDVKIKETFNEFDDSQLF
jgi:hypothetical protein